jgi:hypothetical protein
MVVSKHYSIVKMSNPMPLILNVNPLLKQGFCRVFKDWTGGRDYMHMNYDL